ncbi:hypothetical protein N9Y00_09725 [Tateyamaria sp.]|nr:hypothetical protein [Tateyamaria sp.]
MTPITVLTKAEAEGIKLALSHLVAEGKLDAAISLLETSIEFTQTETGGMRSLMFHALFATAFEDQPAVANRRLH